MKKLSDFDRGWVAGVIFCLLAAGFAYVVLNIDGWIEDSQSSDFGKPGSYFDTEDRPEMPELLGSDQDLEGHFQAYLEYPKSARPNSRYVYIWGVRPVYDQDWEAIFFHPFDLMIDTQEGRVLSSSWGGWSDEEIDGIKAALLEEFIANGEEIP